MKLSDYTIEKTFTSTNGVCYIGTSKFDDKKYFIKKYVDITYGSPTDPPELKVANKKKADRWLDYHTRIIGEFKKIGNGSGNVVFPISYFVDEGQIYGLSNFIKIDRLAVSAAEKKNPNDLQVCQLKSEEKLTIMQSCSYALNLVHELGIIHFDLKPDNLPICRSDMGKYISKIADCDDAVFANEIPEQSDVVCTEPYWSPELAMYKYGNEKVKDRLSCKCDVFAMGLIFHEWWTGDFPNYPGRDDFVCLYQVLAGTGPKKIEIDPSMPQWLAALIRDMLRLDPAKRPTMLQVFNAIRDKNYGIPVPELNFDELKKYMAMIPRGNEAQKYTEASYNELKDTFVYIKTNFASLKSQKQIDMSAKELKKAIDALVIKQSPWLKKLEDAIAAVEGRNLSRYTPESKEKLFKFVNFAKKNKDQLTDDNDISRLYTAIINAYKGLVIRDDFPFAVIDPLPAPYTKVDIISESFVIAHYSGANSAPGTIKLPVELAIKMKLVRKK